ncbi:MAG: ATP-dependent RNA helicase DbpA, partial [Bdellovibrionales bacterium RIFOXYA1_FULL_38_20]
MNEKFKVLKLKQELLRNLDELKFEIMTPIQANALPLALDGDDIIAQAKTGSGKTAVFGLSILNSIDTTGLITQSLIICPTRELAEQVAKEIRTLARKIKDVKILTLCGGTGELHQEKSLQYGAHIIVGTPGRILKLLKKDFIKLQSIKSLILDEADRLLDMGFQSDILEIVSLLPAKRQTMLFSATFPDKILDLSKNIQTNAIEVKIDTEHKSKIIEQVFYEVKSHKEKDAALLKIINFFKPERLIVFCKTKQFTENVAKFLNKHGICAAAINGDLDQNERTSILIKFKNRSLSVLVATDVAARGLDI